MAIGAVVIFAVCYAIYMDWRSDKLESQLDARQEAVYGELLEGMDSLESKLYKLSLLPNSAKTPELLADIWRQTGELAGYFSAVSLGAEIDGQVLNFLNQSGDYAKQLFLQAASGGQLEEQDAGQIEQMQNACEKLGEKLEQAWEAGYSAQVQISEYFLEDARYVEQFSAQEYPHLIYDGPFSQSLETAPALAGATKVSKEQAQKTAEEFAGTALQFVGYSAADKVPFFTFCGQDGQNVAVSELGGEILFWNISHETDISVAPTEQKAEELKAVALDFLEQKGYPQCELSYAQYYGGDALLNLVPLQDGVRLYPDLIKIWVQADGMKVVGMDASAYVKNHRQRTFEEAVALHDARAALPAQVAETDWAMALVPRQTGEEVYCFEFFCNYKQRDAIVYVNTADASVEDILEILHVNNGTLTR